jgi:hypothetical protein
MLQAFTCAEIFVFHQSSARLYGNPKKCNEKCISFRTKIQLCNEIICQHRPIARKTVTLIDSWYTGNEVISNCRKRGYGWIGDLKPNRVIIHDGKRMHVSDLLKRIIQLFVTLFLLPATTSMILVSCNLHWYHFP